MAGYGNQADYEADLLQTYLRRGRVSPISKRDVDLALSIYRMPRRGVKYADEKKLTYRTAKRVAKGKTDKRLMELATAAVLGKKRNTPKAPKTPSIAPRSAAYVPPPPTAPQPASYYAGPLTPTVAPRQAATPSLTSTPKPRRSYSGSGGTRLT